MRNWDMSARSLHCFSCGTTRKNSIKFGIFTAL